MRQLYVRLIADALVLAALLVVIVTVVFPSNPKQASPGYIAGQYVQTLARQAGVKIVGDKIWSVRTHGVVTTVVVRVRYLAMNPFTGSLVTASTTIYVRLARSGYAVIS